MITDHPIRRRLTRVVQVLALLLVYPIAAFAQGEIRKPAERPLDPACSSSTEPTRTAGAGMLLTCLDGTIYSGNGSSWTKAGSGGSGVGSASPNDLLKNDSGSVGAAIAGTDYYSPRDFVASPTVAPTLALVTDTGNIPDGAHQYCVAFVNAAGYQTACTPFASITTDGTHQQVQVTIPLGGTGTAQRYIYRTQVDCPTPSCGNAFILAAVADNVTTTYLDNLDDSNGCFGIGCALYFLAPPTNQTSGHLVFAGATTLSGLSRSGLFLEQANLYNGYANLDGTDVEVKRVLGLSDTSVYIGTSSGFGVDRAQNTCVGTLTCASAVANGVDFSEPWGGDLVAMGSSALSLNTIGYENVAVGSAGLSNTTTGYQNSGLGHNALYSNTTGFRNAAVGQNAGLKVTTGSGNTLLGWTADVDTGAGAIVNATAIGGAAVVATSNTMVFGNSSVTSFLFPGIASGTDSLPVCIHATTGAIYLGTNVAGVAHCS